MAKRAPARQSANQDDVADREDVSEQTPPSPIVTPPLHVVWYTGVSLAGYTALMVGAIHWIDLYVPAASSSVSGASGNRLPMTELVVLMLFAGAVGACISNIRKMVKYAKNFDEHLCVWYYLNPLQGAVCGLIVVILLLGGVLTLSRPGNEGDQWDGTGQIMPFVAFAVLAGYACDKFTRKLSDLADSAFAVTEANQKKSSGAERETPSS